MSSRAPQSEINPYESAREAAEQVGPPPSRGSLFIIFLTVFIDLLGFGMVLPLLPIYAKQFGSEYRKDELGVIIGLLMCSFCSLRLGAGSRTASDGDRCCWSVCWARPSSMPCSAWRPCSKVS